MNVGVIYGLTVPETGEIRYVGQTINLAKRISRHVHRKTNSYVGSWIKSLDGNVGFVILERDPPGGLDEAERAWIATLRGYGCRLTNLTNGGDGFSGYVLTPHDCAKISDALRGRKKSESHRKSLSASATGRVLSAETRRKMSLARKGRAPAHGFTPEVRAKMGRCQAPS